MCARNVVSGGSGELSGRKSHFLNIKIGWNGKRCYEIFIMQIQNCSQIQIHNWTNIQIGYVVQRTRVHHTQAPT